jgi:PIN domain nuclease of toxin-antitoxin system
VLSPEAATALEDGGNEVYASAASAWEIEIKRALHKLEAPDDLLATIAATGFENLSITADHAVEAGRLPPHHADPFDRVLVAQARLDRLTIVTADSKLARYDVTTLPAK